MTESQIQKLLGKGGNFSLPYLIRFIGAGTTINLVNNNEDITYNGVTYKAGTFKYSLPKVVGGVLKGGSLEITTAENALTELVELSDYSMQVEVTGVLAKDGNISPIRQFIHKYGTATLDGNCKLSFSFENDDRMDMSFPPYVFDSENNRGNT